MRILVFNRGSTTLKYKLFEAHESGLTVLTAGVSRRVPPDEAVLRAVLAELPLLPMRSLTVHGGDRFTAAVRMNNEILRALSELTPLAPLHNGPALRAVEITRSLGVPVIISHRAPAVRRRPQRAGRGNR